MRFPSRSRTVLLIADHVPAPTARRGSKDVRGAPGQCRARGHFGSLSWWHPSARTGRALPGVASGRSHPPYPGATSPILPKIRKVRRPPPASIFWFFMRFWLPIQADGPHAQAAPHAHQPPSGNSQKAAKPASPHLADPHAPRIPIRATFPHVSTAPPCNLQAPKIPTLVSIRPTFPAPQVPNQPGPTNSPTPRARPWACTRISVPWSYLHGHARAFTAMVTSLRLDPHASGHASAETSVRLWQIKRQPNSLKSQRPTTGGHGRRRRRVDDDRGAGMSWSGLWPGSPGNRGRLDSTKVRRCGAGSAGRMTDHAGRRPARRHAGSWVRSLHLSTLSRIS